MGDNFSDRENGPRPRTHQEISPVVWAGLTWSLEMTRVEEDGFFSQRQPFAPDTLQVFDFLEFVYAAVAQPIPGKCHGYFNHHHLTFDQAAGQEEFRKTVNRAFARNGVAFEMLSTGAHRACSSSCAWR